MTMDFFEKLQSELLDFNETKRAEWEKNRVPYAAHIELTPKCNFSCIHCYLQNQHNENFLSYDAIIDTTNNKHTNFLNSSILHPLIPINPYCMIIVVKY